MQFPPSSPDDQPVGWGSHNLPRTGTDPYRPDGRWRLALGVISLVLLGVVVAIQRPVPAAPDAKERAAAGLSEHMSPSFEVTLFTKLFFGVQPLSGPGANLGSAMQMNIDTFAEFPIAGAEPGPLGPPAKEPPLPPAAHARLQAAIAAAETLDAQEALARLDVLEPVLDAASPLIGDVALLRRIYGGEAAADVSASLSEADRESFIERHGLFARLALSFGQTPSDVRADAATSGLIITFALMVFGGVIMLAGLTGLGMLIYLCVQLHAGRLRPRFAAPDLAAAAADGPTRWGWSMDPQGRLIWLETVAVFLAGFLILGVSGDVLAAKFPAQRWVALYALFGQWLLLLTLFWPIVRGMPWRRWRGELGWHRGEGFAKEVGAGLMVYLASLPIYITIALLVVLLTLVATWLGWDITPSTDENRLLDLAASKSLLVLVMFFLLATLWAPIVEESIFRGALYRHTRWRFSPAIAVIFTAIVFAIMHGYAPMQLIMVGTLGVVFAIMREWRGSLIGPMTAHFTHNTVVMTFTLTLFGQIGS